VEELLALHFDPFPIRSITTMLVFGIIIGYYLRLEKLSLQTIQKKIMPRRFLNIQYSGIKTEIDVTEVGRIRQVQDARPSFATILL
jgi:hypothetical protein